MTRIRPSGCLVDLDRRGAVKSRQPYREPWGRFMALVNPGPYDWFQGHLDEAERRLDSTFA